jgi:type IV pilus assembly protein PilQ
MNSLHQISGHAQKILIALIITGMLALAAAAQNVQPQRQGAMYGDPGFRGEPINLNVVNADVRDILNYITEQYGVNFVIDKSVKAVPVTVNVSEVPWNIALDSILRSQELGVQVNGTILRVADATALATEGELYRAKMDNDLDSSPLYTEFIRLNYARAAGTIGRGSSTSGTTTVGSSGGSERGGMSGGGGSSSNAGGEGLLPIIKRRLSRRGAIEVDGRSNSLIVTDVRQNIDAIRQLVAILDQPEPQVEIESRIVVATRTFSRDIGVQIAGLVVGPRGSAIGGGTLPATYRLEGLYRPENFPRGRTDTSLFSSIPNSGIGLTTGLFGTATINMLISAGEEKGHAKVIATPRVTTLNNRKARIERQKPDPDLDDPGERQRVVTLSSPRHMSTFRLKLEITQQITDMGMVVLDVLAENASAAATVSPESILRSILRSWRHRSQFRIGGTTVVGGVLFDDEREGQNRTPGLSRVPLLGHLFRRKKVERNTNEILFFITPRISRPDFGTTTGSSGVRPSATIIQPVALGNPPSNSETAPVEQNPPVSGVPGQSLAAPGPGTNSPQKP